MLKLKSLLKVSIIVALTSATIPLFSDSNTTYAAKCTSAEQKDTISYEFSTTNTITEKHTGKYSQASSGRNPTYTCKKIADKTFTRKNNTNSFEVANGSYKSKTCYDKIDVDTNGSINYEYNAKLSRSNPNGTGCGEKNSSIKVDATKIQLDTASSAGQTKLKEILSSPYNTWMLRCNNGGDRAECIRTSNNLWNQTVEACYTKTIDIPAGSEKEKQIATCINSRISAIPLASLEAALKDRTQEIIDAAANANSDIDQKAEAECGDGSVGDSGTCKSSCDIDGIGWIICPVMNALARWNDAAFKFLDNLLNIRPELLQANTTQDAWQRFRDIANVLFVIGFLVIIYSQITTRGITNYGIKKLIPKLVVAAVLVNASYIICQIAVDLSNILGSGMYQLLGSGIQVGQDPASSASSSWEEVMGFALAGAAVILLIVAIALAPTVLLAFMLIVLIVVARQAFVVLLVVVSPIAFVLYLLPNTEQWFKKWYKSFITVLMVYPIIGIVFGASTLASTILLGVAGGAGAAGGEKADDSQLLAIVALGVQAIPLFAVPVILKGSLSAAGSVGAKISGMADRTQKRGFASAGKRAGDVAKRRAEDIESRMANKGGAFGVVGGFRNRRNFKRKSMESNTARRQQSALSEHILDNEGRYSPREIAQAKSDQLKEYNEEIGREKSTMSDLDHSALLAIVKDSNSSSERRAAAAGVIGGRSYRKGHQELIDYLGDTSHVGPSGNVGEDIKTIQQQTAYDMKDGPTGMGDGDKAALSEGRFSAPTSGGRTVSQEVMLKRLHEGKMSEQTFASLNPDDLLLIQDLKKGGHLTTEAQNTIDGVIDRLKAPEMAAVYAASKDNARKIHNDIHS